MTHDGRGVFGPLITGVVQPATAECIPKLHPGGIPQLISVGFILIDQSHVEGKGESQKSALGRQAAAQRLSHAAHDLEAGLSQRRGAGGFLAILFRIGSSVDPFDFDPGRYFEARRVRAGEVFNVLVFFKEFLEVFLGRLTDLAHEILMACRDRQHRHHVLRAVFLVELPEFIRGRPGGGVLGIGAVVPHNRRFGDTDAEFIRQGSSKVIRAEVISEIPLECILDLSFIRLSNIAVVGLLVNEPIDIFGGQLNSAAISFMPPNQEIEGVFEGCRAAEIKLPWTPQHLHEVLLKSSEQIIHQVGFGGFLGAEEVGSQLREGTQTLQILLAKLRRLQTKVVKHKNLLKDPPLGFLPLAAGLKSGGEYLSAGGAGHLIEV